MADQDCSDACDREAELVALSARLIQGEDQLAGATSGLEQDIARNRLEVLLGMFQVASRWWATVPLPDDPTPVPSLEDQLRRLARARLDSEREIARARRILSNLEEGRAPSRAHAGSRGTRSRSGVGAAASRRRSRPGVPHDA